MKRSQPDADLDTVLDTENSLSLTDLPTDILHNITKYFGKTTYYFSTWVCKDFYKLFKQLFFQRFFPNCPDKNRLKKPIINPNSSGDNVSILPSIGYDVNFASLSLIKYVIKYKLNDYLVNVLETLFVHYNDFSKKRKPPGFLYGCPTFITLKSEGIVIGAGIKLFPIFIHSWFYKNIVEYCYLMAYYWNSEKTIDQLSSIFPKAKSNYDIERLINLSHIRGLVFRNEITIFDEKIVDYYPNLITRRTDFFPKSTITGKEIRAIIHEIVYFKREWKFIEHFVHRMIDIGDPDSIAYIYRKTFLYGYQYAHKDMVTRLLKKFPEIITEFGPYGGVRDKHVTKFCYYAHSNSVNISELLEILPFTHKIWCSFHRAILANDDDVIFKAIAAQYKIYLDEDSGRTLVIDCFREKAFKVLSQYVILFGNIPSFIKKFAQNQEAIEWINNNQDKFVEIS
jgi:hypothetical protein